MADTYEISGSFKAIAQAALTKTDDTGNEGRFEVQQPNGGFSLAFVDGSASMEVDDMYNAQLTIAGSSSVSIDLSGSTYFNVWGVALAWASLKIAMVQAADANGNTVTVGGGTNPVIDSCEPVPAKGAIALMAPDAGFPVAGGSTDIFKITNNHTAAVTVDVLLIGVKA